MFSTPTRACGMKNHDVQMPDDVPRAAAKSLREAGVPDAAVLAVDGHLWGVLASTDDAGLPGTWQTLLRLVAADNLTARPPYLLAGPREGMARMLGELGDGVPRRLLSRQAP